MGYLQDVSNPWEAALSAILGSELPKGTLQGERKDKTCTTIPQNVIESKARPVNQDFPLREER